MELVLALAILPLGVAALVSVLTGKPLRVEIMHKHDAPQAVAVEQPGAWGLRIGQLFTPWLKPRMRLAPTSSSGKTLGTQRGPRP